ncbi:MAG: hypothetical protein RJA70_389 [Pseudomonadota bacterium]|jgi:hypothetical protein
MLSPKRQSPRKRKPLSMKARARRASTLAGWACGGVLGCAAPQLQTLSNPHAGLSVQHHFAEGDTGKPALPTSGSTKPAKLGAGTPTRTQSEAPVNPPAYLPDPEPIVSAEQLEYLIRFSAGEVSIESVRSAPQARPISTPRMMGRFAFELWIGKELIDRVRFDFPLLAAEDPTADPARPNLAAGANVTRSLLVPNSLRATHAQIVDRATGVEHVVPWPPNVSEQPGAPP